ncbi:MAG: hypothetical protein CMH30_02950 [Micavibrio sp.]|nr:hypothetical protein [Micavibrio sp.]|tara:strand:- start:4826 stop:5092 length:267 start_codon:yes stop_codon:yes gene_type:complete
MDLFTSIVVFLLLWWTVLFAVLPWGAHRDDDTPEGQVVSAPKNPHIKQKFIITTLIALVLLAIIATLIHYDVMDFRAAGYQLAKDDFK